jgi:hypothetical protein
MGNATAERQPADALVDLVMSLEKLEDDEVLDVLIGLQRAQSRLAWAEQQALVRLAGPHTHEHEVLVFDRVIDTERVVVVEDERRDEIAAALHRSASVVHDQITTARLLNGPLADASRALRDARISPAHVRVLVEQVRRLPGAARAAHADPATDTRAQAVERRHVARVCKALQDRVLPAAQSQVPSQTRALARRAMAAVDAEGEQRRRRAARCTRDVWVSPDDDGIATLVARLDALTAHAIRAAVEAAAADPSVAGDCAATVGERRAEALAALVLGHAQVTAQIEITVPLAAVAGDDAPAVAALADGTLIDWDATAELFDDPEVNVQLRRLVVDAGTGTAIDLGRSRYEVSGPLRRWITARDRTCRFPGCRRRAANCQVDHIEPWDDGGRTDAKNLQALCARHHQLKTHGGWRVSRDPQSGNTLWISPLGREYDVVAEPVSLTSGVESPPAEPDPPPF